ncbi:clathrin light chain, partial [Desarmillaria ectypa]
DDIDFDRAASAFPDISLDGDDDIPVPAQLAPAPPAGRSGFSFDDFDSPPPIIEKETSVKVTGDDDIEKFENEFPDIDVGPTSPPLQQTPTFAPRPQPSALSSTPILTQTIEEDEPEVIKEWRARQAEEIAARDEASRARRQETISRAERAIDEFYEKYNAKKEVIIAENKEQEQEYRQSLTESLSKGTTWERICDIIELQNSQSKTIARAGPGTTDLTRFKEVLLRLRREGDAAPGAGGY